MRTDRPGRLLTRAAALLIAFLMTLGLAAPAAAEHRDDERRDDERDVNRFTFSYTKWNRPLLGVVVGLDPGHNGGNAESWRVRERVSDGRGGRKACNTVGTSTVSGYAEHAFNFDVATELTRQLEYLGATVVLTREDNQGVGPCVDVRGRFAEDNDVDLFVSLHANGSDDPEVSGFFVILSDPPISASQAGPSRLLAGAIIEGLIDEGFEPNPLIDNAIMPRSDIATLNFARRPAVLVELGEMRNPAEAELMESEEGRIAYAAGVARGIVHWYEQTRN